MRKTLRRKLFSTLNDLVKTDFDDEVLLFVLIRTADDLMDEAERLLDELPEYRDEEADSDRGRSQGGAADVRNED